MAIIDLEPVADVAEAESRRGNGRHLACLTRLGQVTVRGA